MEGKKSDLALALERLPAAELQPRLREELGRLDVPERFRLLHELGIYRHPESGSGEGSTLSEIAALRQALPRLIVEMNASSLLDIPCGDFPTLQGVSGGGSTTAVMTIAVP